MGAKVTGFSLEPNLRPGLLEQLGVLDSLHSHKIADIRDRETLKQALLATNPDFVFHLAAQPLVRRSYREPSETYMTNVMGTISLLEAMRELEKTCIGIFITNDKCYENQYNGHYYAETDALGGHDPYSSSKACAELAIASWRRSFFQAGNTVKIASARAGNVIGGGDWSEDRIVPDAIRYLKDGKPVPVRNPHAVRPWQHVLEPLYGYLLLAKALESTRRDMLGLDKFTGAFNFGPNNEANRSVEDLVIEILKNWPGSWENLSEANNVHEASLLHLDISKAETLLGWRPTWDFSESIAKTVEWYRHSINNDGSLYEFTCKQILDFESALKIKGH
jgi:CDP-glucose 4,6-dehydratase